jgi:hypothetical protein
MLTNKLLRKLFDTPSAYRIEEAYSNFDTVRPSQVSAEHKTKTKISA